MVDLTAAATLADAPLFWPDAATIDPVTLGMLLEGAWTRCLAYLPDDTITDPTTALLVQANVLQARDDWTAFRRDGDVIGFDAYAVRVRPLSASVRAMLRPPRGRPMVG